MSGDGRFNRTTVDGSSNETTQIPMGMSRVGGALSPNGTRFTYISQGLENEVWELAGPLTAQASAPAFAGHTGNAPIPILPSAAPNPHGHCRWRLDRSAMSNPQMSSSRHHCVAPANPTPALPSDDVIWKHQEAAPLWDLGKKLRWQQAFRQKSAATAVHADRRG
jgi:hypothetical protein